MNFTYIDPKLYQPWVVIDNHIHYGEDYWMLTFEDQNEDALLQILVHPDIDGEEAYEAFYDIAVKKYGYQNDGFSTQDTQHRNNAPLFVLDK